MLLDLDSKRFEMIVVENIQTVSECLQQIALRATDPFLKQQQQYIGLCDPMEPHKLLEAEEKMEWMGSSHVRVAVPQDRTTQECAALARSILVTRAVVQTVRDIVVVSREREGNWVCRHACVVFRPSHDIFVFVSVALARISCSSGSIVFQCGSSIAGSEQDTPYGMYTTGWIVDESSCDYFNFDSRSRVEVHSTNSTGTRVARTILRGSSECSRTSGNFVVARTAIVSDMGGRAIGNFRAKMSSHGAIDLYQCSCPTNGMCVLYVCESRVLRRI